MWLRIEAVGGLLRIRQQIFGIHKMEGISGLAEDLLSSQEGLCSIELVT